MRSTLGLAAVTMIGLLAACDAGLVPPKSPAEIRDAGVMTAEDLGTDDAFDGWSAGSDDLVDEDLPACSDLTDVDGGPSAEVLARGASEQLRAASSGTATTIHALARNTVLVYASDAAAETAMESIDSDLYVSCISPSVTPSAASEIEVQDSDQSFGDDSAAYHVEMDDYTFFEGTDNTHVAHLIAVRVENVVLVFEFIYSGQYFEDVDPAGLQSETIERVTADVEAAL